MWYHFHLDYKCQNHLLLLFWLQYWGMYPKTLHIYQHPGLTMFYIVYHLCVCTRYNLSLYSFMLMIFLSEYSILNVMAWWGSVIMPSPPNLWEPFIYESHMRANSICFLGNSSLAYLFRTLFIVKVIMIKEIWVRLFIEFGKLLGEVCGCVIYCCWDFKRVLSTFKGSPM